MRLRIGRQLHPPSDAGHRRGREPAAVSPPHAPVPGNMGPPRPRVFLLTSHPVMPPWNGGDKNLARILLTSDIGVDYTFVGSRWDDGTWETRHRSLAVAFRDDLPVAREKLRLLTRLLLRPSHEDLVHSIVTFSPGTLSQHALARLPLVRTRPLVVTCPTGSELPMLLLRRASAVVALSRATEARLRALGVSGVCRIPPGVELEVFTPRPQREAQLQLGVETRPWMLFAGHYDLGGGLENALSTLHKVRQVVPTAGLLVAMRSRPGRAQGRERERLQKMVCDLKLSDLVLDLGGTVNMRLALQAASVILFQPDRLGLKMELPMTLLEALATGRPVVVSSLEPLVELTDDSSAVVVTLGSDQRILIHLQRLLADEAYARARSVEARRLAASRYSSGTMVRSYEELYNQVLGRS